MKNLVASAVAAILLSTTGLTHAHLAVPQATHKPIFDPITVDDYGAWTTGTEPGDPDTLAAKKKKKPKKKKKTKAS